METALSHPDSPVAPSGSMGYLSANVGIGPMARYVNGNFRTTLRLPFAATHSRTDSIARTSLRLQPSFSLLWKANDNFTFDGSAGYSSSETPWSQLIPFTMMQNYRSLSRYCASIEDSHGANARLKMSFKDIFNGIFAHVEGGWNRSWSDIAYGTTIDEQAHTIIEAAYAPNHSESYTLTAYGRKDFDWHTTQLELSATVSRGTSEMLRQSVMTEYRSTGYSLHGSLAFDIVSGYRISYSATWQQHRSSSSGYDHTYSELSQHGQISLRLIPSRLFLNINASHTHNSNLASDRKDYLFLGSGLRWKLSKKIELNLNGDNLTNIHTFTTHTVGNLEERYAEYHLRPWSVTMSASISL